MTDARRGERGVTAVFVAVVLVALLAFVALAMNVGHGRVIRGQLQNAADAAALAAAKELNGTPTPLTNGVPQAWAVRVAAMHETDRDVDVTVEPATDVEFGYWNPSGTGVRSDFYPVGSSGFYTMTKTSVGASAADIARNVNAVRVAAVRSRDRGNQVATWFGSFLGSQSMDVSAEAIATNGGPCGECPNAPLAFFDCGMYYSDTLHCWKSLTLHYELSPDPTDSIGFSSLSTDLSGNTQVYRDILTCNGGEACCQDLSITVNNGDPIAVSNGANIVPLCGEQYFGKFCPNRDSEGNCHDGPVIMAPVVDGECSFPTDPPKFNQMHPVIGLATFRMTKLVCSKNQKYMEFEFLCDQIDNGADQYACGFFGTGPSEPRLVY